MLIVAALLVAAAAVTGVATYRHSKAKADGRRLLAGGRDLLDARHYDRAIASIEAAIAKPLTPEAEADAYTLRGRARREIGAVAEAVADFSKAIELDPGKARAHVERGLAHEAAGDENKATDDFSRAIELRTQDSRAFARRGLLLLKRGNAKEAALDLSEAIRMGAVLPEHFVALARAHEAQNNTQLAIKTLDAALTNFPQHQEARQLRGDLYFRTGELEKANADYAELRTERGALIATRATPPSYAPSFIAFASDLFKKADHHMSVSRFDEALAIYNQLLGMDLPLTQASIACQNRGNAYRGLGDVDRALRDYDQAIRFNPMNAGAYACRGIIYSIRNDHDAAIKDFSEAIRFDPRLVDAFYSRAFAFRSVGKMDAAMRDVNEAVRLQPDSAVGYVHRGWLFYDDGKTAKAEADFEKAHRLDHSSPDALYALATVATAKGAYAKALACYEDVLKLHLPAARRASALNAQAWLRATLPAAKARDGAKAVAQAQEACELTAWSHFGYVDTFAAALAEKGDFDRAADFQWFALSLWPDDERRVDGEERLQLYQQRRAYRESPQRTNATPAQSPSSPGFREDAPKRPSRSRAAPGGIS